MRTTIKDIWERWNFAFGLLLLAPLLVAVALKPGNEDKRQTIIVPERETLSGIFTIDVFAPFDLDALYDSKPPWSRIAHGRVGMSGMESRRTPIAAALATLAFSSGIGTASTGLSRFASSRRRRMAWSGPLTSTRIRSAWRMCS